MTTPIRADLAFGTSLLLAASLAAQSGTGPLPPLDAALLLPTAPSVGKLGFTAGGDFSWRRPEPIDAYAALSPLHQRMLLRLLADRDGPHTHGCWLNPVTPTVAALFNAAIEGPPGFQPVSRWTSTATQGGGLGQGDPTILTYSFVPDGTFIPNGVGEGSGNSNLFASFNAVFPSQQTWQDRIKAAFDRWGELTGTTYVFEPNDDGASMFGSSGQLGVRGDVRIGGKFVDGGSGVLAYNNFPGQGGDMVIDTGEGGWWASSSGNYRRLFNVTAHEHGHGMGIAHVCPDDGTKLMEPYLITSFSGPQYDDILSAQRLYGDPNEPNDLPGSATDLGTLGNGNTFVNTVSLDGNGDTDYFRFTVTADKLLTLTLRPVGNPYLEGPQVGNCSTGSNFDPSVLRNLNFLLLNSAGTGVLANVNAQPAGADEVLVDFPLPIGTYNVRVYGNAVDEIQMYQLQFALTDDGDVAAATIYGTGCGGINWVPINRPLLGSTQFVSMTGIPNPGGSIGLILLGYADIPAGVDLGFVGAPGCRLYVDFLDIQVGFPLLAPTYLWTFAIPNNPSLSGSSVFTQGALMVPPGTNPLGVITANGVELLLGTL